MSDVDENESPIVLEKVTPADLDAFYGGWKSRAEQAVAERDEARTQRDIAEKVLLDSVAELVVERDEARRERDESEASHVRTIKEQGPIITRLRKRAEAADAEIVRLTEVLREITNVVPINMSPDPGYSPAWGTAFRAIQTIAVAALTIGETNEKPSP